MTLFLELQIRTEKFAGFCTENQPVPFAGLWRKSGFLVDFFFVPVDPGAF